MTRSAIRLAAAVAALLLLPSCSLPGRTILGGGGKKHPVKVQTFAVPTAGSDLAGIAAGPDGSLWFTEKNGYRVGHITTAGKITEYPIPNNSSEEDSGPTDIVQSGGEMWFMTDIDSDIYRISADGTYHGVFKLNTPADDLAPSSSGGVWALLIYGDGADSGDNALALIEPDGQATGYRAPKTNHLSAFAAAPDGTVWYNDRGDALNGTSRDGRQQRRPLSSSEVAEEVSSIAFTRDGTAWFTEYIPPVVYSGTVDRYGCCGAIGRAGARATPIGVQQSQDGIEPHSLVVAPDGDLWFAFYAAAPGKNGYNGVGHIDHATGKVSLTSTAPYVANEMVFGGDGALWFIDTAHNLIGRIEVS